MIATDEPALDALAAKAEAALSAPATPDWAAPTKRPLWAPRRAIGYAVSQFMHGELAAAEICATLQGAVTSPAARRFLSAQVADAVPPRYAGSLMTFQTALGFALTFFTVQAAPRLAEALGWQTVIYVLAAGPLVGCWAMAKLDRLERVQQD